MTTFSDLASETGSILFTVGMIVGGTLGYIAQIRVFNHYQSSDGFAPLVSIILLVANTLRVFYWLGAPFAYTLLFQALVMAFVQLVLVMTVLRIAQNQRVARLFPTRTEPTSPVGGNILGNIARKMEERVDYVLTLDAAASVDEFDHRVRKSVEDIDARVRRVLPIGIHGQRGAVPTPAGSAPSSAIQQRQPASAPGSVRTSPTIDMRSMDEATKGGGNGSAFPTTTTVTPVVGDAPTTISSPSSDSSTMSATEERIFGFLASKGITTDAFLRFTPADFILWYILGCFCVGMTVLGLSVLFGTDVYEFTGYLALGTEATFLLPQVYLNYSRRSCEGLTAILLITWVAGDVIKQIYFFAADQPTQFIMCGFMLLCCDATIVFQLITYRHVHPRTDATRHVEV